MQGLKGHWARGAILLKLRGRSGVPRMTSSAMHVLRDALSLLSLTM